MYTLGVTQAEIDKVHTGLVNTLINQVLNDETLKLYSIEKTVCSKDPANLRWCIYLYIYALESWCCDVDNNFLSEAEMHDIVFRAEELNKACCAPTSVEPSLAPMPPMVHDGAYIDDALGNPTTLAGLVTSTTGVVTWYEEVGGDALSGAPALPSNCGVYVYYVTQTNAAGESGPAKITVTIRPPALEALVIDLCQGDAEEQLEALGLRDGATAVWYSGNTLLNAAPTPSTDLVGTTIYKVGQIENGVRSDLVSYTVKVYEVPVVNDIAGVASLCAGSTHQFTNATAGGVWSSADVNIATVSSTGLVTGISEGNTNIIYTVPGGGGCDSVNAFNIDVHAQAPIPGPITGPVNYQVGVTYTFSIDPVDGITEYAWTLPEGWEGISTATSIDVTPMVGYGSTEEVRVAVQCVNDFWCLSPKSIVLLKQASCPRGYTLSSDGSYCYKINTQPAIIRVQNSFLSSHVENVAYGNSAVRFYDADRPSGTIPASVFDNWMLDADYVRTQLALHPWAESDPTKANAIGVWIDTDHDGTADTGAAGRLLTIPATYDNPGPAKIGYIVCFANRSLTVLHNMDVIAESSGGPSGGSATSRILHVIPVTLVNGLNIINLIVSGTSGNTSAAGMMLVSSSLANIEAGTIVPDEILFSTDELRGLAFTIAECPAGWVLDRTDGFYTCKQILTTPVI